MSISDCILQFSLIKYDSIQAWHTLKQNFNHAQSAEEMSRLFAADAASNALYGGRMTQGRQREVKTVTIEAMEKLHKSLESMPGRAIYSANYF